MIELLKILLFAFLFTSFVYLPYYRIITPKNEISFLNYDHCFVCTGTLFFPSINCPVNLFSPKKLFKT